MTVKDLKKGEYFKRKVTSKTTYIRGEFCRELKKYSCIDTEDMNREIFLKGSTAITTEFEY